MQYLSQDSAAAAQGLIVFSDWSRFPFIPFFMSLGVWIFSVFCIFDKLRCRQILVGPVQECHLLTIGHPVVSDEACQSADILAFNTSGVQYCLQDINHYNSKTGVPELIKKKKRKKKKLWRKYATAVGHSCFIEAQIGIFALSCTGNIHFSHWQLIFVAVVLWFGEFSNLLMVLFVLYACFLLQTRIKS